MVVILMVVTGILRRGLVLPVLFWNKGHSAFGAGAGLVLLNFGMHWAGVFCPPFTVPWFHGRLAARC
jgi:hypothetical protein